jgi:hypothetical protein
MAVFWDKNNEKSAMNVPFCVFRFSPHPDPFPAGGGKCACGLQKGSCIKNPEGIEYE